MSWNENPLSPLYQVQRHRGLRGDRSQLQDRLDGALVDLAHTGGLHPDGPHLRH